MRLSYLGYACSSQSFFSAIGPLRMRCVIAWNVQPKLQAAEQWAAASSPPQQETSTLGRHNLVVLPAGQEQQQSDKHQDAGHAKREREAAVRAEAGNLLISQASSEGTRLIPEQRHDADGEQTAGVDGKIEEAEELRALAAHGRRELVGGKGRHARLDAARRERDRRQTCAGGIR